MPHAPTIFLLPGWLNSGPSHWQSRWETLHGDTRVLQSDWQRPLRGDWCARLDEVISNQLALTKSTPNALLKDELFVIHSIGLEANFTGENSAHTDATTQPSIVLVAHSLGCHLVAAWAAASRHTAAVRCALLVAPPDVTRDDFPPDMFNWRKPVLHKLPFPALCVLSSDDPFGSLAAGQAAAAWGARTVAIGPRGHINGDSGLGDWPAGRALLTELIDYTDPTATRSHTAAPSAQPTGTAPTPPHSEPQKDTLHGH
jgi:uncharacterized protein